MRNLSARTGVCTRVISLRLAAVGSVACLAACSSGGSGGSPSKLLPTPPLSTLTAAQLQTMHWSASSPDPAGERDDASVAWTGHELIVAGGTRIDGTATKATEAYDPATNRWRRLDDFPLAARGGQLTAWDGHEMFVWGGGCTRTTKAPHLATDCGILQDGALLNPATGHWRVVSTAPAGTEADATAVADALGHVVVFGGSVVNSTSDAISKRAASYDPASNRWRRLPDLPEPAGHTPVAITAVRWGASVLAAATWEHLTHDAPGETSGYGGTDLLLLNTATGTWTKLKAASTELNEATFQPVGDQLIVAGGDNCLPTFSCPARLLPNFALLRQDGSSGPAVPAPPIDFTATTLTTGAFVTMTGAEVGTTERPGDAAVFDLRTHRWVRLPSARAYAAGPQALFATPTGLIARTRDGVLLLS